MDTTFWTLEYGGQEKSFADWGFTAPKMSPRKLSVTTFKLRIPGATNLVSDPPIPFKGQVKIRRFRVLSEGGYSGGEMVFQGRQITDQRMANRQPADVLTFGDAWWDLENLPFQQQWKYWDNGTETDLAQPFCQLNLFQDFTTGYNITNGAQLEEIIAWAVSCGVNIQPGTIDLAWYIQPYPASALSCASAVQICLKPSPGACCYIDMSTTPPTFHCRERNYHTALSLPYGLVNHRDSEIVPRYDMQVPQVVLQYRQGVNVTVGGESSSWTNFYYDAWPLDTTLAAGVRGGKQVGAMVVPIQLADFQQTVLTQKVTAAVFGDPPALDWWKTKKPAMAGYDSLAYVAGSLKVLDASGTDITSSTVLADFPNELTDGQVAAWMRAEGGGQIGVQAVTVQGAFTYIEKDSAGRPWHKVGAANPHVVSVNVRLTNSPPGTQTYAITTSLDTGQTPVANLAQYIWTLLSWLFWDGTHSIVEQNAAGAPEVGTIIDCRYALNLTGGAAAWASMLSPVHGADIDFTHGTTDIQFGLPKHVGPADQEQLCQFYKFRRILHNTTLRSTGNVGGGSAEVGGNSARENTSNSKAPPALHVTAAPVEGGDGYTTQLAHDAESGTISARTVDGAGAAIATLPQARLTLSDLQYATQDTDGVIAAYFRRIHFTNAQTGEKERAYGLLTQAESDAEDDGNNDEIRDLYFGTGAPVRMRVKEVHGAYLTCRTWNGTTEGATPVYVAKPPELRWSGESWSQTVEGVDITFVHAARTGNLDGKRTASASGKTDQVEIVIPVYQAAEIGQGSANNVDEIWADQPLGGTGVLVEETRLTWMDTNRAARAWCQIKV